MRVAVFHNTLDFRGGADVVCLQACAALARDHDVTLYTCSTTDPHELAEYFDIPIPGELAVRTPPANAAIARGLAAAASRIGPQLAARSALVRPLLARERDHFDAVVSTANEVAVAGPSVQYVHFPQFGLDRLDDPADDGSGDGDSADGGGRLDRLWSRLAEPEPRHLDGATLLANSEWTAGVVERVHDRRPRVVHPPVDPIEDPLPWSDRENGVVVVGRLAPDKRILAAIEVVAGARDRGADLHLHVVGSAPRSYRDYVDRVVDAAAAHEWVHLERDAPRERLVDLLTRHKFGLNVKRREHFGMALAECVAAGMVPIAHDSGGARDVVDRRPEYLFDGVDDGAATLAAAAARDDTPNLPRDRFESERFRAAIRRALADATE